MTEQSDEPWTIKDSIGGFIGGIILTALGVGMVMYPNGGEDMGTEGRRGLYKLILKYIWSTPGGIVVALIGLLILAGTIMAIINRNKS